MTRKELLRLLLLQARANGFEFRKWHQAKIGPWTNGEAAVETLAGGNRYYALLFSHEFARHFWKPGQRMQFVVPTQEFKSLNKRGEEITVVRKAYTRRTLRGHSWEYHLREMAATEEPLNYIRRFLVTEEELTAQRTGKGLDIPDDPIPDKTLSGDPIPGDPIPGDPIPGDPIPDEPIPDEPIPDEPIPDEPFKETPDSSENNS